jgi:hypothetical protein
MYVKNAQDNYVNVANCRSIVVARVAPGALGTLESGRPERWRVYFDADTPANRLPDFDREQDARETAEHIAKKIGLIEVNTGRSDDEDGNSE